MKKKYKLIIAFDGSPYHGWQKQKNTHLTIQGLVEKALSEIFKEKIYTQGSGRTDAKVHSLNHHVVFEAPFSIETENLVRALNSHLPKTIRCYGADCLEKDLIATSDAKYRRYQYLFSIDEVATPFQEKLMTHIPYPLDIEGMRLASQLFVGIHDFKSFMTQGSDPRSTQREVFKSQIIECSETFHGLFPKHYLFEIEATGFLKQMVRLIFGAIVEVGKGKLELERIQQTLKNPNGEHIAPCAPPEGLYKAFVKY